MTAQKDNSKLTITLTGRSPINIVKEDWPVIASGRDSEHDGQIEAQANRMSRWTLNVRQHAAGRTIVYGIYSYHTQWQNERNFSFRGGELLDAGSDIPAAIQRVGEWMAGQEQAPGDESRWRTIINDCIADLPSEEIVA